MSDRPLKKVSFVLYALNAPQALREDFLATASPTLLKLICEIILNISVGNLQGRDFFQQYKSECKAILKKSQSVKRKRETISNQTSDFFNQLVGILQKYA
jgi:RNase P/RNase MRP subunit p30